MAKLFVKKENYKAIIDEQFSEYIEQAGDENELANLLLYKHVLTCLVEQASEGAGICDGGVWQAAIHSDRYKNLSSPPLAVTGAAIEFLHMNWFIAARPFPHINELYSWEIRIPWLYFEYVAAPLSPRSISTQRRTEIHARFDNRCAYCGEPSEEIDHVIPVSKGGTGDDDNLVAACRKCNREKADKTLAELGWEIMA